MTLFLFVALVINKILILKRHCLKQVIYFGGYNELFALKVALTVLLELSLATFFVPDRVFWKNNAKEIILPTLNGQMGILKDHIPVLTGLDTGLMLLKTESDKDWLVFAVMGGFALVNNNKVTILVNEAELASDIDIEEAKSSYDSAKLSLEANSNSEPKKKLESLVLFKRTRTRLQAAQQIKGLSLVL